MATKTVLVRFEPRPICAASLKCAFLERATHFANDAGGNPPKNFRVEQVGSAYVARQIEDKPWPASAKRLEWFRAECPTEEAAILRAWYWALELRDLAME